MHSGINHKDIYPNIKIKIKSDNKILNIQSSTYLRLKFNDIWYLSKHMSDFCIESDWPEEAILINEAVIAFNKKIYIYLICSVYDEHSFINNFSGEEEKVFVEDENQEDETERIQKLITNCLI